jgi:dienelactone hydrolase
MILCVAWAAGGETAAAAGLPRAVTSVIPRAETPPAAQDEAPVVLKGAALYGALPKGEALRLSPDGNNLAMIVADRGKRTLVVWHLDETDPTVYRSGDLEPEWVAWKSNTQIVAGFSTAEVSGIPYQRTASLVFEIDGSAWAYIPPDRDLEAPPDNNYLADLPASSVTGRGAPTVDPGAAQRQINASVMAAWTARHTDTSSAQFQDSIVSLLPRDQKRIVQEVWIRSNGASISEWVGAVLANDDRGRGVQVVEKMERNAVHWMVDPQGDIRLKVTITDKTVRQIYVRDTLGGDWRLIQTVTLDKHPLFGPKVFADANLDRDHSFVPIAFSETNPTHLLVSVVQPSGHLAIADLDTQSGQIAAIVAESADHDVMPVVHDSRLVGYRVGSDAPVYLDPIFAAAAQSIRKALPNQTVSIIDVSDDRKRVLARAENGDEPAVYWMTNCRAPKCLLAPALQSYDKIDLATVAQTRWVQYPARDGLPIPALLTLPAGYKAGALPFVVLVHDGPTAHDEAGFNWLTQFIVSLGYGVLQPEFRGSTGFGVPFERAGDQEWGWKMQDDVTDGTQWLLHQGYADPHRLCIAGSGYGGYSALMGTVREPSLYRCAAAFGPLTNLVSFVKERADAGVLDRPDRGFYREINVERIAKPDAERDTAPMGHDSKSPGNMPEITVTDRKKPSQTELEKISPVYRASDIEVPVLLVHGRKDFVVPVGQSEELEKVLKTLGKPVQSLYLAEGDSLLQRGDDRVALLQALQSFLTARLGP